MLTGETRRRVVHPYWVYDPLLWETRTEGIANFAREGKVGMFNLCWWVLGQTEPSTVVYAGNLRLMWCILDAPKIRVRGKPLLDITAMLTERQFNQIARGMTNVGPMTPQFAARSNRELGYERAL